MRKVTAILGLLLVCLTATAQADQKKCLCYVSQTANPYGCYANGCDSYLNVEIVYTNQVTGKIEKGSLIFTKIGRGVEGKAAKMVCDQQLSQLSHICSR